jgi:hypothetical protein
VRGRQLVATTPSPRAVEREQCGTKNSSTSTSRSTVPELHIPFSSQTPKFRRLDCIAARHFPHHAPNSCRQSSESSFYNSNRPTTHHFKAARSSQRSFSIVPSCAIVCPSIYKMLLCTGWSVKRRSSGQDNGPAQEL